jgi:hypothetical protein
MQPPLRSMKTVFFGDKSRRVQTGPPPWTLSQLSHPPRTTMPDMSCISLRSHLPLPISP